jgi:large conductance mechanosensitive channel
VNSLVADVITPIIGAISGGLDFSNYFTPLSSKVTADTLAEAKKQGAVLAWGSFLTLCINFLIVAFILFLVVRAINKLVVRAKEEEKPAELSKTEQLLTEIRDQLKSR